MPPSIPEAIGKYAIERWIESGGMGDIYLARDPSLDRPVAIKLLREGFDNEEMRERFEREARAAGRLSHPNIVTIYEFGEFEGRPFIAMEFVPGESLSKLIRRKEPIPIVRKLEMMEGLCAGLAHAHRAGIVHRDIKPANLMVDAEGSLKVLDFGIVRMAGSGLTNIGVLVGTVNYMSPEQIAGSAAIDHRSDVFAVGTVLYEVFAYQRAFPGEMAEVLYKIVHAEPEPIGHLVPTLDPVIQRAVAKCLEKSPDKRYQDLTALRRELGRVRHRLEVEDTQDPPSLSGATLVHRPAPHTPTPSSDPSSAEARRQADSMRRARDAEQQRQDADRKAREAEIEQRRQAEAAAQQAAAEEALKARAADRERQGEEQRKREELAARHRQRDEKLKAAQQAIDADKGTLARAALDEAAALGASPETLAGLKGRLDARIREFHRLTQCLQEGDALFRQGALDQAMARATEALRLRPANKAATAMRDRVQAALDAQQRETHQRQQQIDGWLGEARAARQDDQAIAALTKVFEVDPDNAQARAMLDALRTTQEERQRTRAAQLARGRQAVGAGNFAEAVKALRPIAAEAADEPGFADLLKQAEAGLAAAEAAKAVQEALTRELAAAADSLARGDFKAARTGVQRILAKEASDKRALALRDAIVKAEEHAARAESTVEKARALAGRAQAAEAIALLEAFTPPHPLIATTLAELRKANAAAERVRIRTERRARRRQAVQASLDGVRAVARQTSVRAGLGLLLAAAIGLGVWSRWPPAPPPDTGTQGTGKKPGTPGTGSGETEVIKDPPDPVTTGSDPTSPKVDTRPGTTRPKPEPPRNPEPPPSSRRRDPPPTPTETKPTETAPDPEPGPKTVETPTPVPATGEPERTPEKPPPVIDRRPTTPVTTPGRVDKPAPPPPDPREIARQEILRWVRAYEQAYAAMDIDRLRQMVPTSADNLERQRPLLRSASVRVSNEQIEVAPDAQSATLKASFQYRNVLERGRSPAGSPVSLTWNLVRSGSGWIVR